MAWKRLHGLFSHKIRSFIDLPMKSDDRSGTFRPMASLSKTTQMEQPPSLFLRRPAALHVLFWAMILVLLLLPGADAGLSVLDVTRRLINLAFYMLVVYTNLGYLVPRFLHQKYFIPYVLLLFATVAIYTPIQTLTLYLTYQEAEPREFLIMNQPYIFLLQFLFAGGSTVIKIFSTWQRQERDKIELERQGMQSELKFLRSQINPHFLFNTLNSLYALSLKKDDKTPEIVLKLSEILRYMLYECNERRVPLVKEINYIQNYLALEQLRQAGDTEITFSQEGLIADQQIAPLLFIPFLENSFKHGLNPQIGYGYVHVALKVNDNELLFEIRNSRPERTEVPAPSPHSGIGLLNVRQRLTLLYPGHYTLDHKDNSQEYVVTLSLNLNASPNRS